MELTVDQDYRYDGRITVSYKNGETRLLLGWIQVMPVIFILETTDGKYMEERSTVYGRIGEYEQSSFDLEFANAAGDLISLQVKNIMPADNTGMLPADAGDQTYSFDCFSVLRSFVA